MSNEYSEEPGCGCMGFIFLAIVAVLVVFSIKEEIQEHDRQRWLIIDSGGIRYEDVRYPVMQNYRNDEVTFTYQGRSITTYSPRLVERLDKRE